MLFESITIYFMHLSSFNILKETILIIYRIIVTSSLFENDHKNPLIYQHENLFNLNGFDFYLIYFEIHVSYLCMCQYSK